MANETKFILTADEAKAVSAFLRVVDAQKKTESQFGRTMRAGQKADQVLGGMGRSAMNLAASFVSIGAATQAVSAFFQTLQQYSQVNVAFEKEITPLLSLGDNLDKIGALKDQVLALSNAYGRTRQEIAGTLFDLQSGTANLDATTRKQIFEETLQLAQLTGTDLPTSMKVLTKTFQIYREELETVARTQDKVFSLAEQGYLTFEEMGNLLPDVLPAAKAMGYTFDEVGAALITATQYGGRTEKTFTGVRNVFLRMNTAAKEGVELTGAFADKLDQLAKVDPDLLKRIFGDEAIAVIATLAERSAEVRANLEALQKLPENIVDRKLAKRGTDTAYMYAQATESLKAAAENQSLGDPAWIKKFGPGELRQQFAAMGYRDTTPVWAHSFVGTGPDPNLAQRFMRWFVDHSMIAGGYSGGVGDHGRQLYLENLRKAGRHAEADWIELFTGSPIINPRGMGPLGNMRTGPEDAERFARLREQFGERFTAHSYRMLRGWEYLDEVARMSPGAQVSFDPTLRAGVGPTDNAQRYLAQFQSAASELRGAARALQSAAAATTQPSVTVRPRVGE